MAAKSLHLYLAWGSQNLNAENGRVSNYRVKGTEKSWTLKNAESILQVRAAVLSEDERFEKHMENRPCPQFRRYEKTSKNTEPEKVKKVG